MRRRRGPAAARKIGRVLRFGSRCVLHVESGAELGAVETSVPAWSRQGGSEAAPADGPVEGRLADAEQASGFPGAHEAGAVGLVLKAVGERVDLSGVEPPVPARRDQGRPEQAARDSTQNRRLADAEAECYILRTDQSV